LLKIKPKKNQLVIKDQVLHIITITTTQNTKVCNKCIRKCEGQRKVFVEPTNHVSERANVGGVLRSTRARKENAK